MLSKLTQNLRFTVCWGLRQPRWSRPNALARTVGQTMVPTPASGPADLQESAEAARSMIRRARFLRHTMCAIAHLATPFGTLQTDFQRSDIARGFMEQLTCRRMRAIVAEACSAPLTNRASRIVRLGQRFAARNEAANTGGKTNRAALSRTDATLIIAHFPLSFRTMRTTCCASNVVRIASEQVAYSRMREISW